MTPAGRSISAVRPATPDPTITIDPNPNPNRNPNQVGLNFANAHHAGGSYLRP